MIKCRYCPREFASENDLRNHMADKRLVSAAHGAGSTGWDDKPRPRGAIREQYEAAWRLKQELRR